MNIQQLSRMSAKLNELKVLFIFGERVMPFLEEVLHFVQDVIPLLDEINCSIKESASKMPRASSKLNEVSEATELATTEILNTIDEILLSFDDCENALNKSQEDAQLIFRIDAAMIKLLKMELTGKNDALLKKVLLLNQKKQKIQKNFLPVFEKFKETLNTVQDKATSIMMSLQVQDITSQQLAAVNHLIESIEDKLSLLMNRFHETDNLDDPKTKATPNRTFDPNAAYDTSGKRQEVADEIFSSSPGNPATEAPDNSAASQNDIDDLFNNKAVAPAETPDKSAASQNDIDDLFNNQPAPPAADSGEGATTEPDATQDDFPSTASQDEIDKLFG